MMVLVWYLLVSVLHQILLDRCDQQSVIRDEPHHNYHSSFDILFYDQPKIHLPRIVHYSVLRLTRKNIKPSEAATAGVLLKKMFLKNLQYFTAKHLCWSLFLTMLWVWRPWYFAKLPDHKTMWWPYSHW